MVVPALWKGPAAPFGLLDLLIAAGFASATFLPYVAFIQFFPIIPWPNKASEMTASH